MRPGTLYGVSVGPGDPELLTLKAVCILQSAHVIATPGTTREPGIAYGIAQEYVAGKPLLPCPMPMTRDQAKLESARLEAANAICGQLSQGKDVAYLCLGDISIYSSYSYLEEIVRNRGFQTCAVPGIPSFCAAAAELRVPLCQGDEILQVVPGPSVSHINLPNESTNLVILKAGSSLHDTRDALRGCGRLDSSYAIERCGFPNQRIIDLKTDEVGAGYLTLVISRPSRVP